MATPVLNVFFVVTPHVETLKTSRVNFLEARKRVFDVLKPDVYVPEVGFECYKSNERKAKAEGMVEEFDRLPVDEFVKREA